MKAVVWATIELLAVRNYSDISLKQISERAGINSGLIYLYFGSKEDVVREAASESFTYLSKTLAIPANLEGDQHFLTSTFDRNRKHVSFLINAALAPFTRPLDLDFHALTRRLAHDIYPSSAANLASLDAEDIALGLLALGIGFSILERTRDSAFPGSVDLLACVYTRWVHAFVRPNQAPGRCTYLSMP